MKKLISIITISLFTLMLVKCNDAKTETAAVQPPKENFAGYESQVKWGEHLVTVSACHDCHSPKDYSKPGSGLDSNHLLSGYIGSPVPGVNKKDAQTKGWAVTSDLTSWVGPWGVAFAANLTSDDSTGIGKWKEERFIYAIRNGKYNGMASDRNLIPVMPWVMYREMTDEELKAIFSYLKSTKPVRNKVPPPVPPVK
jgi:mono/diheme cytochrome c family protein